MSCLHSIPDIDFVAQLFHCMKKYSLDIPQNIVVYFPQNANDYSLNQLKTELAVQTGYSSRTNDDTILIYGYIIPVTFIIVCRTSN